MRLTITLGLCVVVSSPLVLAAQVLVDDGFDQGIESWSEGWQSTIVWDPLDAKGGTSSGSALVANISDTAGDATGPHRCVEDVEAGELYRVGAEIYVPEGQAETGVARVFVQWHGDACTGNQTGTWFLSNEIASSVTGAWASVSGAALAPEGTKAARIRLDIRKWEAGGALAAHFDNVVFESTDPDLIFVPAAGYAEGSQGSFWKTDLEVSNLRDQNIIYELWWLPRGTDNSEPTASAVFSLASGESRRHGNVLGGDFGLEPDDAPFGAVAVAAGGGHAMVMARVYNQGVGTFGQSIPGVPLGGMTGAKQRQRILFMSENAGFRANLGCQNGGGSAVGVQYELFNSSGLSLGTGAVNLAPYGNDQINGVFDDWAPVEGYVEVWSVNPDARFFCYGSVIDNLSNDPTTVLPQ